MKYALVDDDKDFHHFFSDILKKYDSSAELYSFIDGQLFIQSLSRSHFDVVFLDIEMPEMNGLQIAEHLHSKRCESLIVYITNRSDAVLDAYGMNVIGFVEKRNIERQFPHVIHKIANEFSQNDYMSFKLSFDEAIRIKKKSIAFIEKSGRSILLHTISGDIHTIKGKTLQELKDSLGSESFAYADRSVIVNLKAVTKLSKTIVYVKNYPNPVYISKYRRKEFIKLLMEEMKL